MAVGKPLRVASRRLRRGPAVTVGDLVLTPVALEEYAVSPMADGCWLVVAKRPVAVIVAGLAGRVLLRLAGDHQAA